MSMRRLTVGVFALAVLAGGCSQANSPTTPSAGTPIAAEKLSRSFVKIPFSSADLTVAVGCNSENPLKCEGITAQTPYVAVFTTDADAVNALKDVRTPANLTFVVPSDTVPAGPGPGLFRAYMKGTGGTAVHNLLDAEAFVPSDTVPAGPSTPFLFFRSGASPAAMLFLSVHELARDGILSRSAQPGTPMSILLSERGQYTYEINMVLPPSDTVPAGPGK